VRGDEQSVTNSGRLFHARGPATAKAGSASDERRVAGTTRATDDAEALSRGFLGVPTRITGALYKSAFRLID